MVTHTLVAGTKAVCNPRNIEKQLRAFWELESLGITEQEDIVYDQFHDLI